MQYSKTTPNYLNFFGLILMSIYS